MHEKKKKTVKLTHGLQESPAVGGNPIYEHTLHAKPCVEVSMVPRNPHAVLVTLQTDIERV